MKPIYAGELPLAKVFCSDYDFLIPDYQRPYAWGKEQALQLLDDLDNNLTRGDGDPYFLGSLVLVKERERPRAEVIDGQQRLTTLTIILAVLRDLSQNQALSAEIGGLIRDEGSLITGAPAKPRLTLRERDADYFANCIQTPGSVQTLIATKGPVGTDSQARIRANAQDLWAVLEKWNEARRGALVNLMATRTYLVVVSTPDLSSAHRIFSVMNARGLDLTPSDIFKADVIGRVAESQRASYADRWEAAEQDLGRQDFADLFLHIRMIRAKVRAQRELLLEFPTQVLNAFLPDDATGFVDDLLLPYSRAYKWITDQNYVASHGASRVNAWLSRLVQLDNNDWRPPALWALRHHADDPDYLDQFLRRLERLAASMLLRRIYATPRSQRYAELLRQLEAGDGLAAAAFDFDPVEKQETVERLNDKIYLVRAVRKYVLLRLDETLAKSPGVIYAHPVITVEHVLPQHPEDGSEWRANFTEDEREEWTHRLGNLLLLNRVKNSEAQNYDFAKKKSLYFSGANGIAVFALTSQVLQYDVWTPAVVAKRQQDLVDVLVKEWGLT